MTEEEIERLQAENTTLRAMCAKLMPCHYCGVAEIGLCPHGFPGCALADDIFEFDRELSQQVRTLKARIRELENMTIQFDTTRPEPGQTAQCMWAVICIDQDGNESICGHSIMGRYLALVCCAERNLDKIREMGKIAATGAPPWCRIVLRAYAQATDLEELGAMPRSL